MKKLMIAAAIVCAAALSQAATVNWAATNNALYDGDATAANYSAYLVDVYGATTTYADAAAVAAALQTGTFDGTILYTAVSGSGLSVVGSGTKTVKINVPAGTALPSGYNNSDPVSLYSILFNGSTASAADQYLAHTPTAIDTSISAAGALAVTLGSQAGKEWAAIPEPTSGLLLLLGVAGLALRRRRA